MNSFLQSKEWSEFQESVGHKPIWIKNKLLFKFRLPLGYCYLYSPRPHFKNDDDFNEFIAEAKKTAQKENAIFLRIEPEINPNLQFSNSKQFSNFNFQISKPIQPQDTLILDLKHAEETILKNMHPKTRYNIRVAEKHGVKIEKTNDSEKVEIFFDLALKTSKRDNFSYHPRAYYKQMLKILGGKNIVELLISYHDNIPTASILVLYFHNNAIYLHGTSDWEYRNLMSPYLLQWEAIKEAKKRGCKTYDFWGVAPEGKEYHPWSGTTRFKKGFSPNSPTIHYPGCFEIPVNNTLYLIYKMIKLIRK